MDTPIKDCTVEELEERAMLGEAPAAAELARRYRTGTGGVARDSEEAAMWQGRAVQLDPGLAEELDEGQEPSAGQGAPAAPAVRTYDLTEDETFDRWHGAYQRGEYDNALSRELQTAEKGGNPYAAFVLAQRYRSSESSADRSETLPMLERTRALLERRVASAADPAACSLLVQVLTLLGRVYAENASGEEDLQKALGCFSDAHELDEGACEGLLWFYSGPARKMECFAKDPETLEKLRFTLSEQSAERQGIGPRLDFALRCREEKRLLKAKDWLKLALDAPDAADHPDLCAVARYYQAVTDGQNPDLTELQAVAAGSAWACLLLGDLAGEEEQRLTWYTQGAGIGKDSRTEECRRKQQKILQQREERRRREEERARTARAAAEAAAARKAAEAQEAARRKAAEEREAAERKATEERLRREQDAQYARWSEAARAGTYQNCLSSALEEAKEDGNPYASFVLAQRYLQSSGKEDRAKALPTLERCRTLLQKRCKTTRDDDARALLVQVLTLLSSLYAAQDSEKGLKSAHDCLTDAYKLDENTLETLLKFYDEYGARLPEFRNDEKALDARRAPLAEKSARQGGIVRRLRFAQYCQEHGRSVLAADWLRLALASPDAAEHPAVCSVARYYQDVYNGRKPDLSELKDAAAHSSWVCLVLGDQSSKADEQLAYYRQGAAMKASAEGEESMVAECARRCAEAEQRAEKARQAEQKRQEALRREAEARKAEAERRAAAARAKEQRAARIAWWETAWQAGDYANALSSALQTGLEEENPFAAYVLAQRYLSSGSERDRKEAMDILTRARSIAESNLEENDRPGLRSLLVEILQLLGKTWAASVNDQNALKNAHEALLAANRLDSKARDTLLWFYQGPAKKLKHFADNPAQLEKLCLTLQEQAAQEGGIYYRLRFALSCWDKKYNVKAKDWFNLALNASDAASQPALCAGCRYYLALCNGQKGDLTELNNAAADGSSWACLLLGDLARDEDQKLQYYIQGAKVDPAAEGIVSRVAECAGKRDAIYRRRAVAHNEAIRLRKQEEEEKVRRAEEARLTRAQNSWLTLFGLGYAVTVVAYVVLSILAGSTGSGVFLTVGSLLAYIWTVGAGLMLINTFRGFCPEAYHGHLTKLRITLLLAIAISLLVPMALDTLL